MYGFIFLFSIFKYIIRWVNYIFFIQKAMKNHTEAWKKKEIQQSQTFHYCEQNIIFHMPNTFSRLHFSDTAHGTKLQQSFTCEV